MTAVIDRTQRLAKTYGMRDLDSQLIEASRKCSIAAIKPLIDAGANVNIRDRAVGWTPLHLVACEDHTELARLLIEAGADVNARSNDGWTPLHCAAFDDGADLAELLLDAGAQVNARDKHGQTPLSLAEFEQHTEVADLLRAHGGTA